MSSTGYHRLKFSEPESHQVSTIGAAKLPLRIEANLTFEQLEAYALHVRLEEIGHKLRIGDFVPRERSPSPPPQYDNFGRRTNTREIRYRSRLERERHQLVEKAIRTIPDFKPPVDYKRPSKLQEKVYVPHKDYPEINFIGLLIGPRGNTLKGMERESGAKIAIRGKGSIKEGKARAADAQIQSNAEEDLHCLIIADHEDKVNHAVRLVEEIIQTAASTPEQQNSLKRNQLRELATLNGTLRDDENLACLNCGSTKHRRFECPEQQKSFSANIVCRSCGQAGHIARDCTVRQNQSDNGYTHPKISDAVADQEYQTLMNELNQDDSQSSSQLFVPSRPSQHQLISEQDKLPWRNSGSTSYPNSNQHHYNQNQNHHAPAPWQQEQHQQTAYHNIQEHSSQARQSAPWRQQNTANNESASAPWQSNQQQKYQKNLASDTNADNSTQSNSMYNNYQLPLHYNIKHSTNTHERAAPATLPDLMQTQSRPPNFERKVADPLAPTIVKPPQPSISSTASSNIPNTVGPAGIASILRTVPSVSSIQPAPPGPPGMLINTVQTQNTPPLPPPPPPPSILTSDVLVGDHRIHTGSSISATGPPGLSSQHLASSVDQNPPPPPPPPHEYSN